MFFIFEGLISSRLLLFEECQQLSSQHWAAVKIAPGIMISDKMLIKISIAFVKTCPNRFG